jgi:5-methylcytosine-specific restriction protein A
MCLDEGRARMATVVDHIRPHRGDAALFWDPSNWQPLCKRHHDVKTRNEDQYPEYHY